MQDLIVKKINFEEIENYKNKIKKERVTLANPKNSHWVGLFKDNKLIGFSCCVIKGKTARFKSSYIEKEYRGLGYYNLLNEARYKICIKNNVNRITAFCTPLSINAHLNKGAKIISKKNDICFIEYNISG